MEVELCANRHTQMDGRKTGKGEGFVCKKRLGGRERKQLGEKAKQLAGRRGVGGDMFVIGNWVCEQLASQ